MDRRQTLSIRTRRPRALALLVVTLMAWSSAAAQAAPSREEAIASPAAVAGHEALRVTVDPRIDDATLIPGWVAERSAETMGGLAEQPGHERWVEVRVGGETYAYRLEVTAMRDGKPLGPKREPVVCEGTSGELLKRIDSEVRRAVTELERPEPSESETTSGEPSEPPNGEEHDPPPPPPPRWLLPVGASLTALGGAGLVAGVVMTAVGERSLRTEGIQVLRVRDWRSPTGYAVLGVGAGVLAGGATMLVVRHILCKRAQGCGGKGPASGRARGPGGWAVLPWIGSGELGVGAVGRFSGRRG